MNFFSYLFGILSGVLWTLWTVSIGSHSKDTKLSKRLLTSAIVSSLLTIIFFGINEFLPQKPQNIYITLTPDSTRHITTFREKVDRVEFILGSSQVRATWERLKNKPKYIVTFTAGDIAFSDETPWSNPIIWAYVSNDSLFVDVKLWTKDLKDEIIVHRNVIQHYPYPYQFNFNDNAFEVVDGDLSPILQFIKRTPSQYVIHGIFTLKDGRAVYVDSTSWYTAPHPTDKLKVQRIFKYPWFRHKGEFEED
jgi:hypothetical protein